MLVLILAIMALFTIGFVVLLVDTLKNKLAPAIATPESALQEIANTLDIQDGENVMELGCGDARVIKFCAQKFPKANFVGIDNGIISQAKAHLNTVGMKNIIIKGSNFTKLTSYNAKKYYLYLLPEALDIIWPSLPPESLVVSLEYPITGAKHIKQVKLKKPTELAHKLFVYRK